MGLFSNYLYIGLGIIALLVVLIVVLLGKYRRTALTAVVGVLVLGGGFFLFQSFYKQKNTPKSFSSTAIFKKMEYIQHLKLVSFYSEEVIVLGTADKLEKRIFRQEKELAALKLEALKDSANYENWQQVLREKIDALVSNKGEKKEEKAIIDRWDDLFKTARKIKATDPDVLAYLPSFDSLKNVDSQKNGATLIRRMDTLAEKIELKKDSLAAKGKGKRIRGQARKRIREDKRRLEAAFAETRSTLLGTIELAQERAEMLKEESMKLLSKVKERLREEKKQAADKRDLSRKKWMETLSSIDRLANEIAEARIELDMARISREERNPEILIILPAAVTVFINMDSIQVDTTQLSEGILNLKLPEIEFDPVIIELAEAQDSVVYHLDKKEVETEFSYEGAYYDLFGQLKESILEKEVSVKAKAIENGILKEGEKMARSYLKNFVSPMGYEIRFE